MVDINVHLTVNIPEQPVESVPLASRSTTLPMETSSQTVSTYAINSNFNKARK
jgi:hypothetical protein